MWIWHEERNVPERVSVVWAEFVSPLADFIIHALPLIPHWFERCAGKLEVAARSGDLLLDLEESHTKGTFLIEFPSCLNWKVPLDPLTTKIVAVTWDVFCLSHLFWPAKCCLLKTWRRSTHSAYCWLLELWGLLLSCSLYGDGIWKTVSRWHSWNEKEGTGRNMDQLTVA